METNWNQLIERYLQNELSEEGKAAFEQELQLNPALQEELEMHQLIQSAAKRASQRTLVQQAGKAYVRNVRIRQFTLGIAVTAVATAGIVYWLKHQKQSAPAEKPKQELAVENLQENKDPILPEETLNRGANHLSDNITPLHIPDGTLVDTEARGKLSFHSLKRESENKELEQRLKTIPVTFHEDSVPGPGVPSLISGTVMLDPEDRRMEMDSESLLDFTKLYDSVGRFNDLYCGYALVMHNSKIGFIDRKGSFLIPLIYDQIVVTSNIQSSKDKHRKKRKVKVLYIPKRSGSEVQYCDEKIDSRPASDSAR